MTTSCVDAEPTNDETTTTEKSVTPPKRETAKPAARDDDDDDRGGGGGVGSSSSPSDSSPVPTGGYAKPGDWEAHRAFITQLYRQEDKSLKEVIEIMARDHLFYATPKMYKMRIRKWGLYKNNRAAEVMDMVRLKRERNAVNKETSFYIRDVKVDWADVERYLKRNPTLLAKVQLNGMVIGGASQGIVYRTPSPDPAAAFSVPPIYHAADDVADMVQHGMWDRFEAMYKQFAPPSAYAFLRRWGGVNLFAVHLLQCGEPTNGLPMCAYALQKMRRFISPEHAELVLHVLQLTFGRSLVPDRNEPGLPEKFSAAIQALFGTKYPWSDLWDILVALINSDGGPVRVIIPFSKMGRYFHPQSGESADFNPFDFYDDYVAAIRPTLPEAEATERKLIMDRIVRSFTWHDPHTVRLRLYICLFAHVTDVVVHGSPTDLSPRSRAISFKSGVSPTLRATRWYQEGVFCQTLSIITYQYARGHVENSLRRAWSLYHYAETFLGPKDKLTADTLETVWRLAQRAGRLEQAQEFFEAWKIVVNTQRMTLAERHRDAPADAAEGVVDKQHK